MKHKFEIGQKFSPIGKNRSTWTITDLLTTKNAAGETVGIRYVATHEFMGRIVTDKNVIETTIERGFLQ